MPKIDRIMKASIMLIFCTAVSKALGFVRELAVAYRFGAGSISDAFVLTNSIPTLIFVSIATAININYIPCYQRINTQEEKNRFTSNLTNITLIVLLNGCFLIELAPNIVLKIFANGLSEETAHISIVMLRIVVFSIIPIALSYIFQAFLQANNQFLSTALYGIISNIIVILFTLIATPKYYFLLSVGTIVSYSAGFSLIIFNVHKKTPFRYTPHIRFNDSAIKSLIILTLPLLIEDIASSMSLIVDRNLASYLEEGTISALGYAGTIGNIASTMIATAIMTSTFPVFSKLLAENNKKEFGIQFSKYAIIMIFLLSPISVFMILNSNDIITFIFRHGQFDNSATKIVSESMSCYAVGVLPMGLQSFLIRGFYAMQETKTPVKVKVFALICNIILNLISVKFIQHMGIALSTSISYLISYVLLSNRLRKQGVDEVKMITHEGIIAFALSLVSGSVSLLPSNSLFNIDCLILKIIVKGFVFLILYFGLVLLFRKKCFIEIFHSLK